MQSRGRRGRSKSPGSDSKGTREPQPPLAWKPHPPAKKPPPNTPRDEHGRPIKSKGHIRVS